MMKKNMIKIALLLSLCFAAALMVSCQGDDGEVGPAGTNGTNGTNGNNGTNGTNGVGFDGNTTYGKIKVEFSGTRPDEVAFTHTQEFVYAPTNLRYSSVLYENTSTPRNLVTLARYQGYDALNTEDAHSYYAQSRSWAEQEGLFNVEFLDIYISTVVTFPAEKKYFELYTYSGEGSFGFGKYFNESGNPYYEGALADAEITSYTTAVDNTGKFGYKYTGTIPAYLNSTGFDLTITVTADATVFENLQPDTELGRSRQSAPRAKAVMRSM